MLHLKQVQTGLVKMVITIHSIGTYSAARVKTMHITSDDQGSSEYAGGYRFTDEYGKIYHWGRNNWLTGHNWWTHGWSSTNGKGYNHKSRKIIINSINTKGEKMAIKVMRLKEIALEDDYTHPVVSSGTVLCR